MLALSSSTRCVARAPARASPCAAVPKLLHRQGMVRPRQVVRATEEFDFDAVLNTIADKFEKAPNKPAVIGYAAAAVLTFFTAEWLIHLPALDVLLGFPVQLIGLLLLPYFGLRYFVDGGSVTKDIENYTDAIVKKLPGLDK